MTRNLTLIKSLAVAGVAGLFLTGCGNNGGSPSGSSDDGGDTTSGESSGSGSFSVMEEWEGCEALDDIQPLQDFMGVTGLGTSGLVTSHIGAGLDGEAYTCGAMADLPGTKNDSGREFPGNANLSVGGVPWDSEDEAATNYQERLDQLANTIETGGTDFSNVVEGELGGDWDESYLYTAQTGLGYQINAIGRKGDLIVYTFLDYTTDPGTLSDEEPVYPFTSEELNDWVSNDYMTQTLTDLLAKKESGL